MGTGDRQRDLSHILKFLRMSRIGPAGVAETVCAQIPVQITKPILPQKRASAVLALTKRPLAPLNVALEPFSSGF